MTKKRKKALGVAYSLISVIIVVAAIVGVFVGIETISDPKIVRYIWGGFWLVILPILLVLGYRAAVRGRGIQGHDERD